MSFNLGLNIVETDGKATPSISPAPTSIAAFLIFSQRGVPGEVIKVTNWTAFSDHFGSYQAEAVGAYAVRGFFDNGGQTAHVTRVVNSEAGTGGPARVTSAVGPFTLNAGEQLVIANEADPLSPFAITFTATPAVVVGMADSVTPDLTGLDLQMTINGVDRGTWAFDVADLPSLPAADAGAVAAWINTRFPGIRAGIAAGQLTVETDRRGVLATLSIGGSAASTLFPATTTGGGGGAFGNLDAVTPTEVAQAVAAVLPTADPATQFTVGVVGGRVSISRPAAFTVAGATNATALGIAAGDVEPTAGTDMVAAAASTNTFGTLTLRAGRRGQDDPGGWGDAIAVTITPHGALFDLTLDYRGNLESWADLSMDPTHDRHALDLLNDEFAGSVYVLAESSGTAVPSAAAAVSLSGGENGRFADAAGAAAAFSQALDLFETVPCQLMACPESNEASLVIAGLDFCERMGDRMWVGHTPPERDAAGAEAWTNDPSAPLRREKAYGALYFPWVWVADLRDGAPLPRRLIPPDGHVMGVYARTDRERGVWKAPAGVQAGVKGVLSTRFAITDAVHTSLVKNGNVNAIRALPGKGIVVDSSRTLSTSNLWLYVNVRLLFNFVKSSLLEGLRWVVQEPNDDTLWNKIKFNSVTPFLMGLWRRRAFGPGTPDQVFTVKIDGENNPPANIQIGLVNIEIYFYPSRPAETIVITIGQQDGGGSAGES